MLTLSSCHEVGGHQVVDSGDHHPEERFDRRLGGAAKLPLSALDQPAKRQNARETPGEEHRLGPMKSPGRRHQ